MHIAIVTAGGAGMFCGSCMHDNTWARALVSIGVDVTLVPLYTPIRVDEENISLREVFFGGINVYLDYRVPGWQKLPRRLTRLLDAPWLLNFAARLGVSNDASQLGPLTIAMLQGETGPQRREIEELVDFLSSGLNPDIVCFSNALIVGALRELRKRDTGRVYCLLQGDDIFLDALDEPYRSQAIELIHERAIQFDGFLVHSRYYRDYMSAYLRLPIEKFHIIPLGIDLDGHDGRPQVRDNGELTVGYFARVCPEKGLHQLVEAFEILHARRPETRLLVGGYLGPQHKSYFRKIARRARGLGSAFHYAGSPPTHAEKVAFFKSIDVLSVPTVYREPKGLYVLEAAANGVPAVQPGHGAFPELLESTGSGILVTPGDPAALAEGLEHLLGDPDRRVALGTQGIANVRQRHEALTAARTTLALFEQLAGRSDAPSSR